MNQEKRGFLQDENSRPNLVKPQGDQVQEWLGENHYEKPNIAIFSIGGNDIGFGPIVRNFLVVPSGNLVGNDSEASKCGNLRIAFASKLPEAYDTLKQYMDAHIDYDAVLVTAYPDPTRDTGRNFCAAPGRSYGDCWGLVESANNQGEFRFAYDHILTPLNGTIEAKVRSYPNWLFINGTMNADAQTHGLCNCGHPYFNTIGDSMRNQSSDSEPFNKQGTMHPNRTGHEQIYFPPVYDALRNQLSSIRYKYDRQGAIEVAKHKSERAARERDREGKTKVKS